MEGEIDLATIVPTDTNFSHVFFLASFEYSTTDTKRLPSSKFVTHKLHMFHLLQNRPIVASKNFSTS